MKKDQDDLKRFKNFYNKPNMEDYNYFKKMIKCAIGMKKIYKAALEDSLKNATLGGDK